MVDMHREILDRAESAERKLAMAREALERFKKAEAFVTDVPGVKTMDNVELWQIPNALWPITYGDVRNAIATLAAIDAKDGE